MPDKNEGYSRYYYLDFIVIPIMCVVICAGVIGGCTRSIAGEKEEAEASAAIALAKAKRERESAKAVLPKVYTDLNDASKEADRTGKRLLVWSGIKCSNYPGLCKSIDATHCYIDASRHRNGKALVFVGGDGVEYFIRAQKINDKTADKIREMWALPYVAPIRGDVRISEEISINYNGGICLPGRG